MILGTVNPEVPEVDRDPMVVDNASGGGSKQLQPNAADRVVVNSIPEFDVDPMILDSYPAEPSEEMQGREGVEVKGDPDVNDRSHLEAVDQSQLIVKNKEMGVKKQLKRKRASIDGDSFSNDKEALITECHKELEDLFRYYKDVSGHVLHLEEGVNLSNNSMAACLLEESNLPFSKLADEIFERMKAREGITLAKVRSCVLSVGQRTMYGTSSADADVLEDESESCLWCWETRDLKLLSACIRGTLAIRRIARRKVHERISALSATLSALTAPETHDTKKQDLTKASMKLGKVLNVEGIRLLVEKLEHKNNVEMAEKEARLKEKELIKEMERNKRNAEKERKKMDREVQKEKLHNEKELKRMQEDAEKEVKAREKEETEMKKQLKKQQEEAERDQKRREKEEAELRKQLAIKKQANMMERFLKTKKSSNSSGDPDNILPMKVPTIDSLCQREVVSAATSSMDGIFSQEDKGAPEDHWRSHLIGWRKLSCCNRSGRWGVRRKPKTELVKELKLQKPSEAQSLGKIATADRKYSSYMENQGSEPSVDELLDELKVSSVNDMPCHVGLDALLASDRLVKKKLLQFDKSHRPAYYGTWRKKSDVIGGRHPLKKDPMLDYDVDSDEEWEEEDPGESLSDCDKDNEEILEEENSKADDQEESEDSFVVPDGYLSENEGVQIGTPSDANEDEASSFPGKPDVEVEESRCFLRQRKILHDLTEQALRKNQPVVISNLSHEKSELLIANELVGMVKLEQLCLQALCMRAYPGGSIIITTANEKPPIEDQDICQSNSKNTSTPITPSSAVPDSDLPEFVRVVLSCPHGLSKVVDLLRQKFPMVSKSQLRNKVREISDFVDNRWQVKKEVLDKLGLSVSPEKGEKPKGIAMYFSKRCLPPEGRSISTSGSSPQFSLKLKARYEQSDRQTPEGELHAIRSLPQS